MYKLMIAEDEPLERAALRKIIERKFYNIQLLEDSRNGTEALENSKKYRPDIILMDIRMPETTGLEAQQRIIKYLPNVKMIILTAYSDFNYAQEAIKYGVYDYLLKPVKPDDLKKSIDKAIEALVKMKTEPSNHDQVYENIINNALAYIDKHYCEEIKLDAVAEHVHLSSQYFSRYFKKKVGVTFTEYVTKLRIEKAKKLLLETNLPIHRIAVEIGFSDAAYFSKVFSKCENDSPYQFKKNHGVLV